MDQYIIEGGYPLSGNVNIGGAKNATLPILAAAIMSGGDVILQNVPCVRDTKIMLQTMENIGIQVKKSGQHKVKISSKNIQSYSIDDGDIKKIRASYYFMGALLGRYGHAEVILPGGCKIGSRPINLHLKGFRLLGAEVTLEEDRIIIDSNGLRGTQIYLDKVSVGATINIMMASVFAKGKTTIENAAKEPHVVDTANFLNSMGADIRGAGTDVIRIYGVEKLIGTEYSIIPDQIEAGTYMYAVAATGGNVVVQNVIPIHLESTIMKLKEMGCVVEEMENAVRVISSGKLNCTETTTLPYPGFPTDMQPQMGAIMSIANGTSILTENIFESRFEYIHELCKMGAVVKIENRSAIFEGVDGLIGAIVDAPDLRAGAALIIAALSASGVSTINNIQYIERGYDDIVHKLHKIGAHIKKKKC